MGGGLQHFSVSPRPLGFGFLGFGAKGLGPGLDNRVNEYRTNLRYLIMIFELMSDLHDFNSLKT